MQYTSAETHNHTEEEYDIECQGRTPEMAAVAETDLNRALLSGLCLISSIAAGYGVMTLITTLQEEMPSVYRFFLESFNK